MGFPKMGAQLTVIHNGVKVTGTMTKIRPGDQTVFIEGKTGMGVWVPMSVVRARYGG